MITEDYVSYETAKLLKEKGFNENTDKQFNLDKIVGDYNITDRSRYPERYLDAPTLQITTKWLEEKYGVFFVIRRHGNIDNGFTYSWNCEGKMGLSVGNGGGFKTAAEAYEAGIRYCLENLI